MMNWMQSHPRQVGLAVAAVLVYQLCSASFLVREYTRFRSRIAETAVHANEVLGG